MTWSCHRCGLIESRSLTRTKHKRFKYYRKHSLRRQHHQLIERERAVSEGESERRRTHFEISRYSIQWVTKHTRRYTFQLVPFLIYLFIGECNVWTELTQISIAHSARAHRFVWVYFINEMVRGCDVFDLAPELTLIRWTCFHEVWQFRIWNARRGWNVNTHGVIYACTVHAKIIPVELPIRISYFCRIDLWMMIRKLRIMGWIHSQFVLSKKTEIDSGKSVAWIRETTSEAFF